MATLGKLPSDWESWKRIDTAFISCCKELWVIMLDGWDESTGVAAEVKIAKELGIPVRYITPDEDISVYGRQWLAERKAA